MRHRAALIDYDNIGHGFFTRAGGVSSGIYASLNCGPGSGDAPGAVHENRARVGREIANTDLPVLSLQQVHGHDVITVTSPWEIADRPSADAMVTRSRGVAIGVLTADCCPVLFADNENGIIGAAHAGWRGALGGVVQNTLRAMENIGADLRNIRAAIGPTIQQASYEVGDEVRSAFMAADSANVKFFLSSPEKKSFYFDLPAFVAATLINSGVPLYENLGLDTYPEANDFFSYRRRTHEVGGETPPDYGRQISVICLR